MTIIFVWKEQYAVNVPILDKQHRFLFDLGNDIQKEEISEVKKHVMELYKYATAHFKEEEKHMQLIRYPDLKSHQQLHEKFITDLNALTDNHKEDLPEKLKSFVLNWLIDHILNEDKKYFDYSNRQEKKRLLI